uniref:NADH-ubiquinone oxidoreductase chain 5 n=1 Tax=Carychium tridentatum TaxID=145635 RepID=A0A1S5R317_9EUPU|nr:NADH dehydrogenase subunit 5 [Carychium tridentatum]
MSKKMFLMSCSYLFLMSNKTFIMEYELLNLSSICFSFTMIFDSISMCFGAVVTLIAGCVFTFACKYMEEDHFFFRFIWILLSFVISMNLLIFSGSVFFLLLGWDGLGITSFALIIYYQSYESYSAGFQTLMVNRIGDALIVAGSFLFVSLEQYSFLSLTSAFTLLVLVLCVAALTKSAQYPFSSWLPAAMAAPTPVSALVHSSTLVTAGIYLVIRLSHNLPLSISSSLLLMICGSITCLLGGWAATFENDIKKIIALSTLSQLGVMVFSLGLGFPALALFHLFTHAMFKALLFLAAGSILLTSFGTQDLRLLGGVGLKMPLAMVLFNLSSLCLVGTPFLSAFYSKHLILEKVFLSGTNMVGIVLMMVATMFTAKYSLRALKSVVWSKMALSVSSAPSSSLINLPLIILGSGAIVAGKFFSLMNIYNMELAYIPTMMSNMINGVTILGVILGIMISGNKNHMPWEHFSFLTPLYVNVTKLFSPVVQKLSMLDYGWLEPKVIFQKTLEPLGKVASDFYSWPSTKGSLNRILLSLMVISFGFSFII